MPPGTPPSLDREPRLYYPHTTVRFFIGEQEPTPDIVVAAKLYFDSITSAKSLQIVPNTAHNIEATQAGVDAFIASLREALKTRNG